MRTDWRNGNLDPLSPIGKGFIGQQIISRTYKIDDCNLKMDNFNFYIDLSRGTKYGYGEVKIATLNVKNNWWIFNVRIGQKFDTLFLLCMDNNEPWRDVERAYAIPYLQIAGEYRIYIHRDLSKLKRHSRYEYLEQFRIDAILFNDTYHNMKLENCKVLRKYTN